MIQVPDFSVASSVAGLAEMLTDFATQVAAHVNGTAGVDPVVPEAAPAADAPADETTPAADQPAA